MEEVLKQEVLDKIKTDPLLYGKVAEAAGVAPTSMPRLIYANSKKFTRARVLNTIGRHLKVQAGDLLENRAGE